jgi:hypothetical protein
MIPRATLVAPKCHPTAANAVTVTPNATAWANSAWFEVVPVNTITHQFVGVPVLSPPASSPPGDLDVELDVGVGGAGSEEVRDTWRFGVASGNASGGWRPPLRFPLTDHFNAGHRVSVRMRKTGTSTANWFCKWLYYTLPGVACVTKPGLPFPPAADGVAAVSPASAWGNGSWVEIAAALSVDCLLSYLVIRPTGTMNNVECEVDVAVGASGSEFVVGTYRGASVSNAGSMCSALVPRAPLDRFPAGSRVAVRVRDSSSASKTWRVSILMAQKQAHAQDDSGVCRKGVSIVRPSAWPQAYLDAEMALNREAGAQVVRHVLHWPDVEPTEGALNWGALNNALGTGAGYDALVRACHDAKVRLVFLLGNYTPAWANGGNQIVKGPPTQQLYVKWTNHVANVVNRYRAGGTFAVAEGWTDGWGLMGVQIWDAPNVNTNWRVWNGSGYTDLADYAAWAELCVVSYNKVKSIDRNVLCVAGPVEHVSPNVLAEDFLRNAIKAGLAFHADAYSHHPYAGGATMPGEAIEPMIRAVRAAVDLYESPNTPLWTHLSAGVTDEDTQDLQMKEAYTVDYDRWKALYNLRRMWMGPFYDADSDKSGTVSAPITGEVHRKKFFRTFAHRVRAKGPSVQVWPLGQTYTRRPQKVYPPSAPGIQVTPNGTAWGNTAWVEVWPDGTVQSRIVIEGIGVRPGSTGGVEVDLARGGAGAESLIGTLAFYVADLTGARFRIEFPIPLDDTAEGARLAIRMRKTGSDTTQWRFTVFYTEQQL